MSRMVELQELSRERIRFRVLRPRLRFRGGSVSMMVVLDTAFLLLGFFNSGVLTPLNNFWVKIGIVLGKLISPIIMGIIFFIVVTPIGIFMKLIGKDLIKIKKSKKPTFWIEKKNYNSTMKDQF